jgi:hypothetical protein
MTEQHDVTTMPFPIKVKGGGLPQTMASLQKFIQSIVNYKAGDEAKHQEAHNEAQEHLLALIDARIEAAKKQGKI